MSGGPSRPPSSPSGSTRRASCCSTSGARRSSPASAVAPCDPAARPDPGRAPRRPRRAVRRERRGPGRRPGARRRRRGRRGDRLLPFRQPLRRRRAAPRRGRLPGAELRGLVARVVARPGARRPRRAPRSSTDLRAEARRLVEERVAERPSLLVPGRQVAVGLGPQLLDGLGQLLPPCSRASGRACGGRPRRGTGSPRRGRRAGTPAAPRRSRRAARRRPGGRTCSSATGRRGTARAASRRQDRPAVVAARPRTSRPPAHPGGPTDAPAARAISCAPRQTPRSGTPSASAVSMNPASPASQGCSASWSGCIAPPKTITASQSDGAPGGASPSAATQRSSRCPRSVTVRSKIPPPPVGAGLVDDREDAHDSRPYVSRRAVRTASARSEAARCRRSPGPPPRRAGRARAGAPRGAKSSRLLLNIA